MTNLIRRPRSHDPARYIPRPLEPVSNNPEESLDIQRIFGKLIKRKFQILIVVLIILIPAAIATFLTTPLYRSTATLQVVLEGSQVLPYKDAADYFSGSSTNETSLRTQEQILKSQTLADRVAERLNAETMEVGAKPSLTYKKVEIRRIIESQIFEISCLAPSPALAAKVVNFYAEEYIKQHYEARQIIRQKSQQALGKELELLEKRVQVSENELVRYARDNNIMNLERGQVELVQQKLALLDQQSATIEGERVAAKSRWESIEKASVKDFPEKLVTPNITYLESKLLQLEHDLTALLSTFGEKWPSVVQKQNEILLVRDQLAREKSTVLAQAREQAKLDFWTVEGKFRMLSASLAEQKGLVNRYHDATIQYNILRREVETNQKLYEGLLERLKQTGVLAGFEFGNIQVIESGRPNSVADTPKIWWNLGLASLLGLALGICVAFLLDFWDNSISTLEEIEQIGTLPGLGSVPWINSWKPDRYLPFIGRKKIAGTTEQSVLMNPLPLDFTQYSQSSQKIEEAMRTICASILLSRSEKVPRVIMFTSATPSEGKTTLVSHLGMAFAESGSNTLLVDADLRKPVLSKIFGAGIENGLTLFLSGLQTPLPKIHKTDHPNLHLVTSGPMAPNPVALLNSVKMDYFLDKMAQSFQFILIDTPPILVVSDARVMGPKTDGVVLVVRAGETAKNLVRRAWALIENAGGNALGMILNGAAPEHYGSYYYQHNYREPEINV